VVNDEYLALEATCTEGAVYYESCLCGDKSVSTFVYGEALGHTYEDGVCTECGENETTVILTSNMTDILVETAGAIIYTVIYLVGQGKFFVFEPTETEQPEQSTQIPTENSSVNE
jgi:hypothetical protein